jgi:hypothetical protein
VSKTVLWIAIGAAVFVVVALAVLTPTVIVDDNGGHERGIRVSAPGLVPVPSPFRSGRLPGLKRCLENHGFGTPGMQLPSPDKLRGALRDCAPRLGG